MPVVPAFALLLSTAALAQAGGADLPPPPPPPAIAAEQPARAPDLPRFGLAVDAGAPEGVSAAAVWRPVAAFRLWGGPSWNYVAFGVNAGATIAPFRWAVAPTLTAEAGRYFEADLTWLATRSGGVPVELAPLLRRVAYDYASLQLGLELGSQRGLSFSIRAGVSWLSAVARGTASTTAAGSAAQVELVDPRFTATMPSVKLGLQYWF
jgi:hypothetical protein